MFLARLRPDLDLRLLEERHAAPVFALVDRDREYLREWLPWVDSTLRQEDTLSFIRASLEQFASNSGFAAGVWWNEQFVGVIGTHKIDWLNRKAELGYWLGKDFQGHGIVTDACRAAITHLLVEMDLNRVVIQCATGNAKSCAIPRRLGFSLEGTMREGQLLNGRYEDLLLFAMLRRDWKP
ncbi:MAG TPA: GNAT family N-acetyltransferase [Bryobacteraceae bacterium]|jgi:ribosomal-protein-serine acetyltransferase|nr:GNAT family N-acetyltransferase [Bryobacteraceae bacterium]